VDLVRNTLYANIFYIRAQMDNDYLGTYLQNMRIQERNQEAMRVGMFILGAAMVLTAFIPGVGPAIALWGADLMSSSYTGKSLFDHAAHGIANGLNAVGLTNFSQDTIQSFQFWNMVSDRSLNFLLQEMVAMGITHGINSAASALRGGSSAPEVGSNAKTVAEKIEKSWKLRRANRFGLAEMFIEASDWLRETTIGKAVSFATKVYMSCTLEVIFEFSFEAVMRFDENERPGFGSGTARIYSFFAVMTAATLIGGITEGIRHHKNGKLMSRPPMERTAEGVIYEKNPSKWQYGCWMVGAGIQVVTLLAIAPALIAMSNFS
jgi:hypothetical protein